MRSVAGAYNTALGQRVLRRRNYIWMTVHDRITPATTEDFGFHDGVGTVVIPTIDGFTLSSVDRTFLGAGSMVSVDRITLVSDVSVRNVTVKVSQIDEDVANAVRGYDARNAPIQIFRGLYDESTNALVSAAICRFLGYVDEIDIETPPEGQLGSITLQCVSQSRELGRTNPDVRSHASQQMRHPSYPASKDSLYRYAATSKDIPIFWGRVNSKVPTKPPPPSPGDN